ncbi:MAG: cation-translocating P-type ATPase, partial [Nitriliruptoraceae bacterium]
RRAVGLRVLDQVRDPMNLLLIAAAALSGMALGEVIDAIAISAIVAVNIAIALVQEGRAGRALAALEQLRTPTATVIRNGEVHAIPATELVVGDIIRIAAGDRIPADAELVDSATLEVDESMLTGESVPVAKSPLQEDVGATETARLEQIFWGTFVSRGTGLAIVTATGADTALGQIAAGLAGQSPDTPLQKELRQLSGRLGIAAIIVASAVVAMIVVRVGLTVEGAEQAFLSGVALAVAAVPEGLPTVTLIALATGVRRMAAHGAIVRRLPAVETLGSATVIVTDKTGTITQNRMAVAETWSLDATPEAEALPGSIASRARTIASLANDADLDAGHGDPMEVALLRFAADTRPPVPTWPRVADFPIDSHRKRMSTVHESPEGLVVLVKGAPETVLDVCTSVLAPDGAVRPLRTSDRTAILAQAHTLASRGLRVLGLADRPADTVALNADDAERGLTFVALVGLADPVRDDAADAVAAAVAAGVRVVMATGDHPETARAIGDAVGLDSGTPVVLGGAGTDVDMGAAVDGTTIFARVNPSQKVDLVEALQAHGEVVAMIGDGVNDAPALRRADIGVALGRRGSDVAREAGDMIVTDDNLATIVVAIREGRGIYDNVRKVVDYLVAGNLSEVGVVLGALLLFPALSVPLLPLQLLWINLLSDGLPALALGTDRHDPSLMARRPRDATAHLLHRRRLTHLVIRGTILATACLGSGLVLALTQDPTPERLRTLLMTTLVAVHLAYAFVARQPEAASWRDRFAPAGIVGTPWLSLAVLGGFLLQVMIVSWPPAMSVFHTATPPASDWLLIIGGAAVGLVGAIVHRRLGGGTAPPTPAITSPPQR